MDPNWPSNILCPVDFSQPSAVALRFAANLAAGTHARLTLMHAHFWEAPPYFTESQVADLSQQFKDSMQDAEKALGEFAARECPDCGSEQVVVDMTPVDGILKAANDTRADIIVMGTHGRSGFNRFLLGSVTERVVREASIPIATVRSPSDAPVETGPIRKLLCPVNDSAAAKHSLRMAARLATSIHAELIVVHVEEGHGASQRPEICNWLSESEREGCSIQEVVESGNAAERILKTAVKLSADLLVIGAQHRRFADATVIGTTTIRVVRHSPIPVLTIVNPAHPE